MKTSQKTTPILYIGGSGRSGTNITKELLARHSQIHALPFEHRITIDPRGLADFYNTFTSSWSPYLASERITSLRNFLLRLGHQSPISHLIGTFINRLSARSRRFSPASYHGWRLARYFPNYDELVNELIESLTDFSFAARWPGADSYRLNPLLLHSAPKSKQQLAPIIGHFINSLVAACLNKYQRDVFVEDNTWNILFARELLDFTPQAKILHIYRNPRDVIASLIHQRWAPSSPLEAAQWLSQIMSRWFEIQKQLPKDSFLELSLEDLVADPQKHLRKICSFMGLDFEEQIADFPLDQAHIGRWKSDLSSVEIKAMRDLIDPIEKHYGYDN